VSDLTVYVVKSLFGGFLILPLLPLLSYGKFKLYSVRGFWRNTGPQAAGRGQGGGGQMEQLAGG
jgi:hypothetical protein